MCRISSVAATALPPAHPLFFRETLVFSWDDEPPILPAAPRRRGGKHDYDPRMRCLKRRRRRWAVYVRGGRQGKTIYVGLFVTVDEAIRARDDAERRRAA